LWLVYNNRQLDTYQWSATGRSFVSVAEDKLSIENKTYILELDTLIEDRFKLDKQIGFVKDEVTSFKIWSLRGIDSDEYIALTGFMYPPTLYRNKNFKHNPLVFYPRKDTEVFYSVNEAEQRIGKIDLPNLSNDFKITQILYTDDGFTHPTTIVCYRNSGNKEVIFMIASDYDGIIEYENINNSPIGEGRWITKHSIEWGKNKYILQWRKSSIQRFARSFSYDSL